jgi:hypothetical protein
MGITLMALPITSAVWRRVHRSAFIATGERPPYGFNAEGTTRSSQGFQDTITGKGTFHDHRRWQSHAPASSPVAMHRHLHGVADHVGGASPPKRNANSTPFGEAALNNDRRVRLLDEHPIRRVYRI